MKALVVYDDNNGNVKTIVDRIIQSISRTYECNSVNVKDFTDSILKEVSLLIVGSPTIGSKPTKDILNFFNQRPKNFLHNIKVTSFDTRIALYNTDSLRIKFKSKLFGYAAPKIAKKLVKSGGYLITPPEGFLINIENGLLEQGEETRAQIWANTIICCWKRQMII